MAGSGFEGAEIETPSFAESPEPAEDVSDGRFDGVETGVETPDDLMKLDPLGQLGLSFMDAARLSFTAAGEDEYEDETFYEESVLSVERPELAETPESSSIRHGGSRAESSGKGSLRSSLRSLSPVTLGIDSHASDPNPELPELAAGKSISTRSTFEMMSNGSVTPEHREEAAGFVSGLLEITDLEDTSASEVSVTKGDALVDQLHQLPRAPPPFASYYKENFQGARIAEMFASRCRPFTVQVVADPYWGMPVEPVDSTPPIRQVAPWDEVSMMSPVHDDVRSDIEANSVYSGRSSGAFTEMAFNVTLQSLQTSCEIMEAEAEAEHQEQDLCEKTRETLMASVHDGSLSRALGAIDVQHEEAATTPLQTQVRNCLLLAVDDGRLQLAIDYAMAENKQAESLQLQAKARKDLVLGWKTGSLHRSLADRGEASSFRKYYAANFRSVLASSTSAFASALFARFEVQRQPEQRARGTREHSEAVPRDASFAAYYRAHFSGAEIAERASRHLFYRQPPESNSSSSSTRQVFESSPVEQDHSSALLPFNAYYRNNFTGIHSLEGWARQLFGSASSTDSAPQDVGAAQAERARQALTSAARDGSLGVALALVQRQEDAVAALLERARLALRSAAHDGSLDVALASAHRQKALLEKARSTLSSAAHDGSLGVALASAQRQQACSRSEDSHTLEELKIMLRTDLEAALESGVLRDVLTKYADQQDSSQRQIWLQMCAGTAIVEELARRLFPEVDVYAEGVEIEPVDMDASVLAIRGETETAWCRLDNAENALACRQQAERTARECVLQAHQSVAAVVIQTKQRQRIARARVARQRVERELENLEVLMEVAHWASEFIVEAVMTHAISQIAIIKPAASWTCQRAILKGLVVAERRNLLGTTGDEKQARCKDVLYDEAEMREASSSLTDEEKIASEACMQRIFGNCVDRSVDRYRCTMKKRDQEWSSLVAAVCMRKTLGKSLDRAENRAAKCVAAFASTIANRIAAKSTTIADQRQTAKQEKLTAEAEAQAAVVFTDRVLGLSYQAADKRATLRNGPANLGQPSAEVDAARQEESNGGNDFVSRDLVYTEQPFAPNDAEQIGAAIEPRELFADPPFHESSDERIDSEHAPGEDSSAVLFEAASMSSPIASASEQEHLDFNIDQEDLPFENQPSHLVAADVAQDEKNDEGLKPEPAQSLVPEPSGRRGSGQRTSFSLEQLAEMPWASSAQGSDGAHTPESMMNLSELPERANVIYFKTPWEQKFAREVMSGEEPSQSSSDFSQTRSSPRKYRRQRHYDLMYHCKEEARVASSVFGPCTVDGKDDSIDVQTLLTTSLHDGQDEADTAEENHAPPASGKLAVSDVAAHEVLVPEGVALPALGEQRPEGLSRPKAWLPLRGSAFSVPVSPKPPEQPKPASRKGTQPHRPLKRPAKSRYVISFPIQDAHRTPFMSSGQESEAPTIVAMEDDSTFLATLSSLRESSSNTVGSRSMPPLKTTFRRRPPGWSSEWVSQNSIPSRWRFASNVVVAPEASRQPTLEESNTIRSRENADDLASDDHRESSRHLKSSAPSDSGRIASPARSLSPNTAKVSLPPVKHGLRHSTPPIERPLTSVLNSSEYRQRMHAFSLMRDVCS